MKTILSTLLLFSIFFLESCVQAPQDGRKSKISSSASSGKNGKNTTTAGNPVFGSDEYLYWYTSSKITSTVTINKNSQDIVYLRGKLVHDFLNAKDLYGTEYYRKQYCMVGNFSNTSTYKQMRIRAIPIYIRTASNAIERLLRIDIPSSSDNSSACQFTLIDTIAAGSAAFSLPAVCPTCIGQVTTSNISLYEAKTSSLVKVESTLLNTSSILVKIDFTSNSTDPNSSCTNSSCSAKGFDCCISGQCVKDASEKTNASSDPQYTQAKTEYAANPLSFINYPNIFNVCSNISHLPPGTVVPPTTTPVTDAQARVAEYLKDYTCISDVTAGLGYANCLTTLNEAAYLAIKKKLSKKCGCTAADDQMAVKCPDWGILPVYPPNTLRTNANIIDFTCYTPTPENPIGPIVNLNVSIPNRSAPHRFYSTAGTAFDSISGLKTSAPTTLQEGDDFYYLDEFNKAGPINNSFNVNSILGRMSIDLNRTLPAKIVNVELGKTYIVSATSGFFTPCSQCIKDSWFQIFTAFPTSQRGMGLQATGYTTSRDTYSANSTFGNYEDTKFGRACYVPVTMLPFAHYKNASLQTQRQNRLKTQAAMYINGYQKDWYGFNKGALIGSYDGVTWFSIGTGRRTTATTTKLFLALNASFLDLADRADTVVNIIPDLSSNTASNYDYDPELSLTDVNQNTGATCQRFHQCENDADCVTQLGWEYSCADVSQYKTAWPVYDGEAKENSNQEITGTLFDILQTTISTSSNKRCIYRGAGAPCKMNYTSLTGTTASAKKLLTCAPNFYCAALSANKFNDEVARSPNELDDILFGMDTNILGRPLNYVTATKSLSSEIISNIKHNASSAVGLSSNESDDMGICRPGRSLTSADTSATHAAADVSKRTDYISQIGSCNSATTATDRIRTCPAFDSNSNLIDSSATGLALTPKRTDPTSFGITSAEALIAQKTQNSCGGEAKNSSNISAFKSIEGLNLVSFRNITLPTLAQDACFRRAGSICHTDLDCSPNKMHEEVTSSLATSYFGNTEAEQNYWKESLICGQVDPAPATNAANYFDYKLSDNRCCREIGKDFTMYTQGPTALVPENTGTNAALVTSTLAVTDPTAQNRYSRYTISNTALSATSTTPKVTAGAEPSIDQWKVINETGSLTCCGGGWIRKFADGTHDWKVRNRLTIDSSNFSCLNFRSPLADSAFSDFTGHKVNQATFQREFETFCKYPELKGCMQIPFQDDNLFTILSPKAYDPATHIPREISNTGHSYNPTDPAAGYTRLDTSPSSDPTSSGAHNFLNSDVPYPPVVYTANNNTPHKDNYVASRTIFLNGAEKVPGVQFYLPAYIGYDGASIAGSRSYNPTFINKIYIKYFYATQDPTVDDITLTQSPTCSLAGQFPLNLSAMAVKSWCIIMSPETPSRPVVIVRTNNADPVPATAADWTHASIVIDFKTMETYKGTKVAEPGNAMYYLSKLGRLELLGIPQITYEPLYCNNGQDSLVPGIFTSLTTRAAINAVTSSYTVADNYNSVNTYNADGSSNITEAAGYGNAEKRFLFQDKIIDTHPAIFSSKDFTCCTPLGKKPTSAAKCCSGHATGAGATLTCKLPKGADLNVYFNKFVSSEGVGTEEPGGGLIATRPVGDTSDSNIDFNPYTGEPKFRQTTYDKLTALGGSYCDGTVETGAAFGAFPMEPFSGSYFGALSFIDSIVDSNLDSVDGDQNLGKIPFDSGFRWNHHLYCK